MCCHTGMPCRRQDICTSSRHSIETRGRPVAVLSIDVERHTGIPNYQFYCLGSDPIRKSVPGLLHTSAYAQLYDDVMVVVSQKLGKKCTESCTKSSTRDLWCADKLRFFSFFKQYHIRYGNLKLMWWNAGWRLNIEIK